MLSFQNYQIIPCLLSYNLTCQVNIVIIHMFLSFLSKSGPDNFQPFIYFSQLPANLRTTNKPFTSFHFLYLSIVSLPFVFFHPLQNSLEHSVRVITQIYIGDILSFPTLCVTFFLCNHVSLEHQRHKG